MNRDNGGTPGTAGLYEIVRQIKTMRENDAQRRRAMLLSWVDEAERECGYGDPGMPPRTSQIRQFWRECGEPELRGG